MAPLAKCLNRGWHPLEGGETQFVQSTVHRFSVMRSSESFAVKCSDDVTVEVDILCHTLAFFALRRLIVISKERS